MRGSRYVQGEYGGGGTGGDYSWGRDCQAVVLEIILDLFPNIPALREGEMCCDKLDKGSPTISGKWGGEIVIRCPSCGAIIIMDSTPSAPENTLTTPEISPQIFPAELKGQWGQIKFTN